MNDRASDATGGNARLGDGSSSVSDGEDSRTLYASNVRVEVASDSVLLIFTRVHPSQVEAASLEQPPEADRFGSEVIARIALPPAVVQRLLRLLPRRLDAQSGAPDDHVSAEGRDAGWDYASDDGEAVGEDPFLKALAQAELDDEPYTDEDRAASDAGWEDYLHGRTSSLEEVRQRFSREDEAASAKAR